MNYLFIAKVNKAILQEKTDFFYVKEAQDVLKAYSEKSRNLRVKPENYTWFTKNAPKLQAFFENMTPETLKVIAIIKQVDSSENAIKEEVDPIKKYADQQILIDTLNQLRWLYPQSKKLSVRVAESYGFLAWVSLFAQQFPEAEAAATKGLQLDSKQDWIYTNLALGYLYQGKMKEARKLYKQLKDKPYQKGTFKDVFLEDLDLLEAEGITCEGVKDIRALLKR